MGLVKAAIRGQLYKVSVAEKNACIFSMTEPNSWDLNEVKVQRLPLQVFKIAKFTPEKYKRDNYAYYDFCAGARIFYQVL